MRAIGIILAGGNSKKMRELADRRTVAAMPVAGCYRSIDFALSNMTNSGIQKVAVLTQYNARSLNEHLGSSKWWNFGRKQGGLFIYPPAVTGDSWWYKGTADALYQNLSFLRNSREQYVVIASGDCIYKLDFDKVMDYHAEKGADVTVVCTECTNDEISRFGVPTLDEDSRIRAFDEKPTFSESTTISAGIYILRRRLLIRLLEQCAREGRTDFVRDILIRYKDTKKIYGYRMNTYWSNIATVESYFRTNMDFLKPEVRDYFFRQYPGVYSKMDDNPPAKFFSGSSVKNSLVAAGSIVDGVVENSILFKKVYVGKGCIIRNSIILNDVFIGNNTTIENCIVESRSYIKADAVYHGEDGVKIIIEQKKGT